MTFRGGSAFPQSEQGRVAHDLPFAKVSDLGRTQGDRYLDPVKEWISDEQRERLSPTEVAPESVVFAKIGEGLRAERFRQVRRTTAIDNNMMAATARPGVCDSAFLFYLLQTLHISQHANGSALPYLTQGRLQEVEVDVPPAPEQQAIAEVLGALDDKIAANRALVATAEELMTTLVHGLPTDGTLDALCTLSKASVTPDAMEDRVWHYSLPAFDEHGLPSHELSQSIKSNKFVVDSPCVLLSKLNPRFPRVWNVPRPKQDSVASTEFLVLHPVSVSTSVLWALLSDGRVSTYLTERAAGTSGSHQRVKPAEVMQAPIPAEIPNALQQRLTALGMSVQTARQESAALATLRDTLLPALMDGTLRVQDAEKTVSEAL